MTTNVDKIHTHNPKTDCNLAPISYSDINNVKEDALPNPVIGNVLTNDHDPNGDTLSVTNAGTFNLGHGQGYPCRWLLQLHLGQHQPRCERPQQRTNPHRQLYLQR